ncbi:MAG TPA: carbohydrate kinase family protein [Gemmatimonadaceae bacterium]|nr:carbohydrate kinase family protein [Gemmatimonadaceae bacterium]
MSRGKKRLGVIGTFVWDIIHGRDVRDAPLEEWGGITYALSACEAALGDDWELVPLVKVGSDLAPRARDFLRTLKRVAPDAAPIEVPFRNNRVEIRYHSAERRSEVLSGGVPGWSWAGLQPLLRDIDALYVNHISGFELDLATAQLVRQHFKGPIYCDLHSLVLGVEPSGLRTYHALPEVAAWCATTDFLQVNEDELAMLAPDSMALAATAMAAGVHNLIVTLGKRGVVYFATPHFERLSDIRTATSAASPLRTALVPASVARTDGPGDPTGCGDVWGATYFSRLVSGDIMSVALRSACDAAARNVEHRGATGLAHHLRGELHAP